MASNMKDCDREVLMTLTQFVSPGTELTALKYFFDLQGNIELPANNKVASVSTENDAGGINMYNNYI